MLKQQRRFICAMAVCALTFFLCMLHTAYAANGDGELIIFHTNDMHGRILIGDDSGKSIGLAEIAAAVKNAKRTNPDTLWLDAGDTLHGMPIINVSKGEALVPLLNMAGVDAFVPGNHDFDYGFEQLKNLSSKMKFSVISANVALKENPSQITFAPYKIFNLKNGIRVAVFGLTTPETLHKTHPKHVEKIQFLNPVTVSKEMVKELRPKCDVLIALTHLGVDENSKDTSKRVAAEVSGIDIIVDGHSHTELPQGIAVGSTLIAQTGCYAHYLGKVTVTLKNHRIVSKEATLLNAADVKKLTPNPDEGVVKAITAIQQKNAQFFNTVVAKSERELSGDRALLRCKESELGNLCADAFRWRSGADIAIVQGGGIRMNLPKGNVTRGDTISIFPFGNTLQVIKVKGNVIRKMLEHSVAPYPKSFGGFLDVSGLTFSFDPTKPAGGRVTDIYVGGQPLNDERDYTLSSADFLIVGGDGYAMLKGHKVVAEFDTCDEILADYLNKFGLKGIETGRIKIINDALKSAITIEDKAANSKKAA